MVVDGFGWWQVVVAAGVGWGVVETMWSKACRGDLSTGRTLRTMEEGSPVAVGGAERVGGRLERLIFLQLMGRACSLRLGIVVEICSVGALQLKGVGWHSGDNQGILGAPSLRIDGCSDGGVVEEVYETFLGSSL